MNCLLIAGLDNKDNDSFILNQKNKFNLLFAVDGGIGFYKRNNLFPDYYVGDLDSSTKEDLEWGIENAKSVFFASSEKDYLDTELALIIAQKAGAVNITIYNSWGGRPDHTVMNLSFLFFCLKNRITCQISDKDFSLGLISENEKFCFSTNLGDIWSFTALERCEGVTYKGLKYILKDGVLDNYSAKAGSNIATDKVVEIEISKGKMVYCHLKN